MKNSNSSGENKTPQNFAITKIPVFGEETPNALVLQKALKARDFDPGTLDGQFGSKTKTAVQAAQKAAGLEGSGVIGPKTLEFLNIELRESSKPVELPKESTKTGGVPKWLALARSMIGMKESNTNDVKKLSEWWKFTNVPSYKTIVGRSCAWCAMFICGVLATTGYNHTKNAAAISYNGFGQKIEWKVRGIPAGAILHIKTTSGNHVSIANGDCAPADLLKAGATIVAVGGNQGHSVKPSVYSMTAVKYAGWPSEDPLPPPVTKSVGCTSTSGKPDTNESTR